MKQAIHSLLFSATLLVITATSLLAQPTIGTTTFNGTIDNFDVICNTSNPCSFPLQNTVDGWTFATNATGTFAGITENRTAPNSNVAVFSQNTTLISFKSSDGSEFKLENFRVQDVINISGAINPTIYTITAYKDNSMVGSISSTSVGTPTSYRTKDFSSNLDFADIDEVRITSFSGGNGSFNFDEITISPSTANTPPTSSSFTASNGPFEDLTYTFSTADFGYSDVDGDPLSNILIESLPAAGTLYVDVNNNNTFDSGEQLFVSSQVSKANLDAGNLQYIQNGSSNTSFQFEVNDGTENSTGNYIATLNVVATPSVTLSISPSSRSESVSTNVTVTGTLSNAYGATTTITLGFGGTASNSADYTRSGTSISVTPGSTTGSITLSNVDDALYEGNETVIVDITGVTGGSENGTQQQTYTIIENDALPTATLSISSIYNPITDESGGQAIIVSELSAVAGVPVTVPLTFTGTATGGGTDYGISGSSILISAGQASGSITVTSNADGTEEGDETVIIDMGTPTNATEDGTQQVTLTIQDEDASPPSGYTVSIDQSTINLANESLVSFTFAGAESGATYSYTFSSSGGGTNVTGSGTITTATDQISGIDLSGLGDGTISLSVTLTDGFGNTGSATNDSATKDATAPAGYSVAIDQAGINATNENVTSFTFAAAEVGTTYNYTFSSSGGGTNVTGSGAIATTTDQISGIDLSGLGDGTISLSVTLTDAAGNTGTTASDTETKDVVAPTGYSVVIDQAVINATNENASSFTFAAAEVGTTYNYTFSSSGGGTNVTGSGTIVTATDQITSIDISGLGDGTITLSATLTDGGGNTGTAATDTKAKDATAPTGYSVSIDQAFVNLANETAVSFTFAGSEIGTTYNYTFSSSGGGTNVTGSGTIVTATDQITGIDISGLGDGTITLSVTLTDGTGNTGSAVTDTKTKDTSAPNGYALTIDQSPINSGNQTAVSFTFSGAEVGTTYNYSFSSDGGGTNVTGSSTVATATDQITGLDVSTLGDGTITLSVTLTDAVGNTGTAANDTEVKETVAPSGYSVVIDQSPINTGNETAVSFTFAGAEVGTTYNTTFSSSGGGANVTGSGTISTATDQITGFDLSALGDGTITLSVTLTDGNGNVGSVATDTETKDTGAPTGYTVALDQAAANAGNVTAMSFTFTSAEAGATYDYTVTSTGGGTNVTGSGTTATATDQITGIDVSGLGDGTLTLSVTLTDVSGNTGTAATDNVQKDVSVPSGYSVSIDLLGESFINATNENIIEFSASGLEVGTTLNYSFTSDAGGTPITGTVAVTSSTEQFDNGGTGYDLSGLTDGTITLTISLTDDAGNTGSDVTDTQTKDAGPPTGYSVTWDAPFINASTASSATFTVSNAEIGATLNNSVSSSGDGNTATVSNPITVTSNTQVVSIDVSALTDGVLTVEVSLTDGGGNTGGTVNDNSATLDQTIPSGYTVSVDQASINDANQSATSFTFAGAEVGATYNYTFSSDGGGTNVTGTGSIASANEQITGIDVSGLGDGTLTLSATLTDEAGNTGASATNTVLKDASAPTFISVDDNGGDNTYRSGESLTIVANLAETGLNLTADLSVINSGLSTTAPMVDNGDGTYSITVADVDATGNMIEGTNIAVTLTATDGLGNQATDNSLLLTLDKTAPTGYTVSIDQAVIDNTNQTALSFTFASAEVGTTYAYTISSTGGGTNVTGSGSIATANDQITDIDVSGLSDGLLSLSVTLTDLAGNIGEPATNIVTKNAAIVRFTSTESNADESQSSANIQLELTTLSAADITVDYSVSGSATGSGTDYTLADGSLTISAGSTNATITISGIVDDNSVEGDETIILTLSSPQNASLGESSVHTYTINDNDQLQPQSITFASIEDQRVGNDPVMLQATGGDSGLPVTFAISTQPTTGVASLSNNQVIVEGVGTVTVTASQAGNEQYEAAEDVSVSFEILANELLLPTLFSPNNDRINDRFILRGGGEVQNFKFSIYDRDGNLVFSTNSFEEISQEGWDGRNNGRNQPQGTYLWVVQGSLVTGAPLQINGAKSGIIRLAR